MRPYHYLCLVFMVMAMAASGIFLHIHHSTNRHGPVMLENQNLAAILGLSDLVLSTEARYIRHLSLTDFFSPFQDTPSGFDLLPSGSFFPPPRSKRLYPNKDTLGKP